MAGDPTHYFLQETAREPGAAPLEVIPTTEERPRIVTATIGSDDIALLLQEGFEVDDDNQPAEENIPVRGDVNLITYLDWGFRNIDLRHEASQQLNHNARIPSSEMFQELQLFWKFFPKKYITDVVLPQTNKHIAKPITLGEFTRWIGLCFLMSTIRGCERREFWSIDEINEFSGAPYRFSIYMTRGRFEDILSSLSLTDKEPPLFIDKFYYIRQMVDCWNDNMKNNFVPSWISCLDESMCTWTSKYTCPGWMVVPRKPHPYGNEYHTICCGKSGIMYTVEIVEGKDRPKELGKLLMSEKGKTVGLVLRMTTHIHGTGKVVVMDSGFCVLDALLELKIRGVYGSAVIKKRKYWPKGIKGDEIIEHMHDRSLGDVDALYGTKDNKSFYVYAMKDAIYTMMLMATYGSPTIEPEGSIARRSVLENGKMVYKTFRYKEPYYNHYRYRHAVDDHNAKRHAPISLEAVIGARKWEIRQFFFLLAVTEVNVKLGLLQTDENDEAGMLRFRRRLAKALINNHWIEEEKKNEEKIFYAKGGKRRLIVLHELMTRPVFTGKYDDKKRKFSKTKKKYSVLKCSVCHSETRNYCSCNQAIAICDRCFGIHRFDA